jgi:hypothetical protein
VDRRQRVVDRDRHQPVVVPLTRQRGGARVDYLGQRAAASGDLADGRPTDLGGAGHLAGAVVEQFGIGELGL